MTPPPTKSVVEVWVMEEGSRAGSVRWKAKRNPFKTVPESRMQDGLLLLALLVMLRMTWLKNYPDSFVTDFAFLVETRHSIIWQRWQMQTAFQHSLLDKWSGHTYLHAWCEGKKRTKQQRMYLQLSTTLPSTNHSECCCLCIPHFFKWPIQIGNLLLWLLPPLAEMTEICFGDWTDESRKFQAVFFKWCFKSFFEKWKLYLWLERSPRTVQNLWKSLASVFMYES